MSEPEAVPVVFIHGLWMHASSWTRWVELFTEKGYAALAPGWPGDGESVDETRAHPERLNRIGVGEATEHYAALIRAMPAPPVVIGHSFGGLIAQRLIGLGLTRGGVAMAPAQFKGILGLPPEQVRSVLPILSKPWLRGRTWTHTKESYAKTFANGVPREESDRLFDAFVIPAPCRPLFQASVANFAPRSPLSVNTKATRGPLLLLAGSADRTVPASAVRAAYKIQSRNPAPTEFDVLTGRGHSFPADSGWQEAADRALTFLAGHGL
jgi:non-heme chloroperoxidase